MIYSIVRYYAATAKKILIVVPTTSLVEQMVNDFISYGWNADDFVHKIYGGKDKIRIRISLYLLGNLFTSFLKDILMT